MAAVVPIQEGMSAENVEFVRAAIEAENANGWSGSNAHLFAPGAPQYTFPEWPGAPAYHGPEGARQLASEYTATFDDFRWNITEMLDFGDMIISLARLSGRTKEHGIEIDQPFGAAIRVHDGLITEARYFMTWEEALAAARENRTAVRGSV